MSTTTKKVKSIPSNWASLQSETKLKFELGFIQKTYSHKAFTFTAKDLPLIEYMASEFVNEPSGNRDKDNDNIYRILRCLQTGNWYPEVMDIHIDTDGVLKNGQHTLDAIIQWFNQEKTSSNASVVVGFKLGTDPSSMPYLDSARPRSVDQTLTIGNAKNQVSVNKFMRDVVKFETRHIVHDIDPLNYGGSRRINFYEMVDVVNKNTKILERLFGEIGFPGSDFGGGIRYALFKLGQKNLELAGEICDEIRKAHMDNSNISPKPESSHCNKMEEHELIEHIRSRKASAKQKEKTYDNPIIYTDVCAWITEKYSEVDSKTFAF